MADPTKPPGFFRRHMGRFIASAILTVCVLWGLKHSGLELVPPWSAFAGVRWWTVPVYLLIAMVQTYFRASRWRFLLRKVGSECRLRCHCSSPRIQPCAHGADRWSQRRELSLEARPRLQAERVVVPDERGNLRAERLHSAKRRVESVRDPVDLDPLSCARFVEKI